MNVVPPLRARSTGFKGISLSDAQAIYPRNPGEVFTVDHSVSHFYHLIQTSLSSYIRYVRVLRG
jgi:hypothetical protein